MFNFIELISTENKDMLIKVSIYCKKGFQLREDALNAIA